MSSGSLGTYTGNGLGPGFAYTAGFSLLVGYIGFATTGTLGGVLYLDSFLESIGLGSHADWFRLLLVWSSSPPRSTCRSGGWHGREVRAGYSNCIAIASILVIIVGSYVAYGFGWIGISGVPLTWSQHNVRRGGVAVGSYAGFESVASLGAEAKDAHRNIARSLLRVVLLLGVLYVVATYPQVLIFDAIDGDKAVLPQLADTVGVSWTTRSSVRRSPSHSSSSSPR